MPKDRKSSPPRTWKYLLELPQTSRGHFLDIYETATRLDNTAVRIETGETKLIGFNVLSAFLAVRLQVGHAKVRKSS